MMDTTTPCNGGSDEEGPLLPSDSLVTVRKLRFETTNENESEFLKHEILYSDQAITRFYE